MKLSFKALLLVAVCSSFFSNVEAQTSTTGSNVIPTAVPFLTIAPDSRGSAMGDAGAATSADVNSQFWNPAKYAFIDQEMGVGISYSPWMKNMVQDMDLSYVSFFRKLDQNQALSASLRYFSLGTFTYLDEQAVAQSKHNPNEFAVDFAYSRKLSENWSGSVALRYIRSDLALASVQNVEVSPANAFAADVAFLYRSAPEYGRESGWSAGIVASNIGTKLSYDNGNTKDFIPANLRLGMGFEWVVDDDNQFNFAVDVNKLMVPTPSYIDASTSTVRTGKANDYSTMGGIFRSFSDASFKEEMQEFTTSLGVEYWYQHQFALRTGYFRESPTKGSREYVTFGAGINLYGFTVDLSYLYTVATTSPLENTLRFSLAFDFGEWFQGKK